MQTMIMYNEVKGYFIKIKYEEVNSICSEVLGVNIPVWYKDAPAYSRDCLSDKGHWGC